MMRRLKKWKLIFIVFVCTFFSSLPVFANELQLRSLDVMDRNDFTYQEALKYLDRFTSKLWVPPEWLGFSAQLNYLINSFVQAIFWANKKLFNICSEIYRNLMGAKDTAFNDYVTIAIDSSKAIYDTFYSIGLIPFLGAVAAGYAVYVFFFKNGDFVKTILKFFIVYATTTLIFTQTANGNYLIKDVYNKINEFSSGIVSASVKTLNERNKSTDKGAKLSSMDGNAELQQYFNISIWKPYEAMNSEGELTEGELVSLLKYNSGDNDFKLRDKEGKIVKIGEFVGEGDRLVHPRLSIAWGEKFSYAIGSLFDTITLGLILDSFAITSFSNMILIIGLLLLSGFVSVLALFPRMENVFFNFSKKLFGAIFLTSLTQLGSMIALWMYTLLYTMAGAIFGNPLIEAFVKTGVVIILWKKRDSFISLLTAGSVTQIAHNFSRLKFGRYGSWQMGKRGYNIGNRGNVRPSPAARRRGTRQGALRELGVGAAKLGLVGAGAGLAKTFSPQLQAVKNAKMALETGKLGQTGRKMLNLKDKAVNKLSEVRSVGVNQKRNPVKYQDIQDEISKRKEKMAARKRINDRLSGKLPNPFAPYKDKNLKLSRVSQYRLPSKESPELRKYKQDMLAKRNKRIERRMSNIKSYAKEKAQREYNNATKARLMKQREKRLNNEPIMPNQEHSMGAFKVAPKKKRRW